MRQIALILFYLGFTCLASQGQPAAQTDFQLQTQTTTHTGAAFRSVTLSATAEWYAGSTHETGTAQLQANVDGSSSVQLNLGQASRTETQTATSSSKTCSWADQVGRSHNIRGPNCFIAIPWFSPSLFTQSAAQLPAMLGITDDGNVADDEATLHQISFLINRKGGDAPSTSRMANASKVKVHYDPTTLLPASLSYSIHPDDNDLINLKVKVLFSNYQSVSGVMLPFHIEKYVQNTLQLTFDVTKALVE